MVEELLHRAAGVGGAAYLLASRWLACLASHRSGRPAAACPAGTERIRRGIDFSETGKVFLSHSRPLSTQGGTCCRADQSSRVHPEHRRQHRRPDHHPGRARAAAPQPDADVHTAPGLEQAVRSPRSLGGRESRSHSPVWTSARASNIAPQSLRQAGRVRRRALHQIRFPRADYMPVSTPVNRLTALPVGLEC